MWLIIIIPIMGATNPLNMEARVRYLAGLLKKDRVNAVLLVPVCPLCTVAVGGLARFLEDEGLSTVHISLIRLHTEQIKPPRALWVPFELGRPFGPPDNPAFQTRVLLEALELFAAENGPVLKDFEEDAPQSAEAPAVWACPINLPAPPEDGDRNLLLETLKKEIARLAPWYDLAREKRGRTTMGASGLDPDALADFICRLMIVPRF